MNTLPHCLTREPKVDQSMSGHGVKWYYLYCANCGGDGGRVMESYLGPNFAFYLCEPCGEKWGALTGTYVEPDATFWERVVQEQIEQHGRLLTPEEQVEVLKDENSTLRKLLKDKPDFTKIKLT